ncbi:Hypothetical protein FKW44_001797 [Caligus rogercresseyi]|uniref:Uncharacterized protein n=1 Tax=Caligus rogercresseyi TaxID=217165 RepID=A0A7T8KJ79_CALRO|nr:Hypothetical protein FKW44_001797 [Caligus rogercresseyi]
MRACLSLSLCGVYGWGISLEPDEIIDYSPAVYDEESSYLGGSNQGSLRMMTMMTLRESLILEKTKYGDA